jgi:hypothetical protein
MTATKIVRTEKTVRGPFGKLVKWAFILFNIVMLCSVLAFCAHVGNVVNESASDAETAGAGIGGALGSGFLMMIWLVGDVVLGMFVLFTKGKKIVTEETIAG